MEPLVISQNAYHQKDLRVLRLNERYFLFFVFFCFPLKAYGKREVILYIAAL